MFQDNEYVVKSVIIGKKKMLDEKSNLMVEQTCVKAITIEHKGCIVAVGSGISDYERLL
jgi:hypothetical protein